MEKVVSSKQELLDKMLDRANGSKVIQRGSMEGSMVLDYDSAKDGFYFAPTILAQASPIDDEVAIKIYNEYFVPLDTVIDTSLHSGDNIEEPLVYETDIVEYMDLSAVNIEDYTLELVSSPEFEAEYSRMLHAIDTIDAIKKTVNDKVKELMKERYLVDGENKIEGDAFNMTLIPENYRETFDTAAFKEAHPELFEQFKKVSKVRDSIRINRKKRGK